MQLFQGEEPTHDFLSLHTGGSSSPFQHRDDQHSSQGAGYGLGVHNSLKPLKLAKQRNGNGAAGNAAVAIAEASSGLEANSEEHVLPGGVGTFSIRQASDAPVRGGDGSHRSVRGAFAPVLHGSGTENTHETGSGSRAHHAPSITWQDSAVDQRSIATRAEGRSSASSGDQGPSTPRSKHSATEQRRRTKINDRLEILRELLPHCDQKRDKASFLLEVIEYIRFLQEKVQKYESADLERNHEDSKSMPWAKVYYRSCWRNTQNISQVQDGDLSASAQDMNKEQCGSKRSTVAPVALFSMAAGTPQNWAKNSASSNQPPRLSMSTMRQDSDSGNRMLSKHERQTLHDDTHSLSSAYSQGLLNRLTEALKMSGVDMSQANISVEINMDRRARENASDNSKVNEGDEPIHITKRLRCDKS